MISSALIGMSEQFQNISECPFDEGELGEWVVWANQMEATLKTAYPVVVHLGESIASMEERLRSLERLVTEKDKLITELLKQKIDGQPVDMHNRSQLREFWYNNGEDITAEVNQWISANNIPVYRFWNADHREKFKARFIDKRG